MTIKISEVAGGPYTHEIDAIRDERQRAVRMHTEPDFEALFDGVEISTGAAQVIADIDKPIEFPVGEFVENVKFNVEETETPEASVESGEETANPNFAEGIAPEETGAESGNGETSVESSDITPEQVNDLQDAEELLNSPIFDDLSAEHE